VTYAIDLIVTIESVVGDIDRPFGLWKPTGHTSGIFR
jgi:hypothetical protein